MTYLIIYRGFSHQVSVQVFLHSGVYTFKPSLSCRVLHPCGMNRFYYFFQEKMWKTSHIIILYKKAISKNTTIKRLLLRFCSDQIAESLLTQPLLNMQGIQIHDLLTYLKTHTLIIRSGMRQKAYFLFLLLLAFSCNEEEAIMPNSPAMLHKTGLKQTSNLRVFSSNGEIKTRAILNRFEGFDSLYFNYNDRTLGNYNSIDSLQFMTQGNARLFVYFQWIEYSLSEQENSLVMTRTLQEKVCCYTQVYTQSVEYYLGKIKSDIAYEYIYSSTGGNYLFGYTGRQRSVLQKVGDQWGLPIINYSIHQDKTGYSFNGWRNNVLQADFYKHIVAGDTVAIRESVILFDN